MVAIARVSLYLVKFTLTIIGYPSKTVKRLLKPKSENAEDDLRVILTACSNSGVTAPIMMTSGHANRSEDTKFRK